MNRPIRILSAVLAFQVALAAVVLWPRSQASVVSAAPLFGELQAEGVKRITIDDADGKSLVLERLQAGWVLPGADGFPVQPGKVDDFLQKVSEVQGDRLVTRTASSHARLRVAEGEYERRITIESEDGSSFRFFLGSSPNFGAVHIRQVGKVEAYLTSSLTAFDARTSFTAWVNTSLLSIPTTDIDGLVLQNELGEFAAAADENGRWTLADLAPGEQPDSEAIASLVSRVAMLTLVEPVGMRQAESHGFDDPLAVLTILMEGRTITLTVGAKDATGNNYFAKLSESPYIVKVSSFSVSDLIGKGRQDYLVPPPTPTEEQPQQP